MVGKKTLVRLIKEWLGKPFEPGRYDCIHLFGEFYNLPEEFREYNWKKGDYIPLFYEDREKAMSLLEEFIRAEFTKIDPSLRRAGDLIAFRRNGIELYGIYTGNNQALTVLESEGAKIIKLPRNYEVWRRKWEAS